MLILGLISGTSADGIDAALCDVRGAPPKIEIDILHGTFTPYPAGLRARTLAALQRHQAGSDEICRLNVDLAEAFANAALQTIAEANLLPRDVDLIGSHGQTLWHEVDEMTGHVHSTFQVVEASVLAERTGITTISNFRARDVAAGGQGAPLASYADWLLLRHPSEWRALQNLGGIANMTFLPPLHDVTSQPLSFDSGPANCLVDPAIALISDGAHAYDKGGALALAGEADPAWLEELLRHPYYNRRPPKSTGRELFSPQMAHDLVREGRARHLRDEDIIATLTALSAHSIARAYQDFAPQMPREIVISGGGQHNRALLAMLSDLLPEARLLTLDELGINGDLKEAMVFALLAHETWHNRPGALPAFTGAQQPCVLGQITPGENFVHLTRLTWCGESPYVDRD